MKSGTGSLPVGFCGIGILPMIHGLEAHATPNRHLTHPLGAAAAEAGCAMDETRLFSRADFLTQAGGALVGSAIATASCLGGQSAAGTHAWKGRKCP